MMKSLNKAFAISAAFALATAGLFSAHSVSAAVTYYVSSTTGSDSSPGTASQPFQTIQKAADIVDPGDTVIIKDGTYTDTNGNGSGVYLRRGGTSDNWVTFKSENKWGAILDGQNNVGGYGFNFNNNANFIRIEGFEIKGWKHAGIMSNNGANDLYIGENDIHFQRGDGMYLAAGTTNVTANKNVIHDIGDGSNQYHGIYMKGGSGQVVTDNTFFNCGSGWCIHFWGAPIDDVTISGNTFAFPNTSGSPGQIILASDMSNVDIEDNIFYQPVTAAIRVFGSFTRTNIQLNNNQSTTSLLTFNGEAPNFSLSGNQENVNPLLVDLDSDYLHMPD